MASTPIKINLGNNANDGLGDDLRTAFAKTIDNFNQVKSDIEAVESGVISNVDNAGSGESIVQDILPRNSSKTVVFKTLVSSDTVVVSSTDSTIKFNAVKPIFSLTEDNAPTLSNNLNLNSNSVIGEGNVSIDGNITATRLTANVISGEISSPKGTFQLLYANGGELNHVNVEGGHGKFLTVDVTNGIIGDLTGTVSTLRNHSLASLDKVYYQESDLKHGDVLGWDSLSNRWTAKKPNKLPTMTTEARDQYAAENGEMIYNETLGKIQAFANGTWIDLH